MELCDVTALIPISQFECAEQMWLWIIIIIIGLEFVLASEDVIGDLVYVSSHAD